MSMRWKTAFKNRTPNGVCFSSPEQAVAAAKVLFSPVAERVRQQNRAVIPEMIHVYYD